MTEDINSWFGIVDPQADDDARQTIRNTADSWIAQLEAADSETTAILAALSVAIGGVNLSYSIYQKEIDALFDHISKSRNLTGGVKSNDNCLRIFCLMALCLILEEENGSFEELVSEVLISGLQVRSAKGKPKLEKVYSSCLERAWQKLDSLAIASREAPNPIQALSKIPTLNLAEPAGVQQLHSILNTFCTRFEEVRSIDREELDVLWWMINGYSDKGDRPFRDMPPGVAAIACGLELADIGLDPPGSFLRNLLRRQLHDWFPEDHQSLISLDELVNTWGNFDFSKFLPEKHGPIEQHPHIFPLHWTLLRLHNSESKTAWQKEFDKTSTLSSKDQFELNKWSIQALQERIALTLWITDYGT